MAASKVAKPAEKLQKETLLEAEISEISNKIRLITEIVKWPIDKRQDREIKDELKKRKYDEGPVDKWKVQYEKAAQQETDDYEYLLSDPFIGSIMECPSLEFDEADKKIVQEKLKDLKTQRDAKVEELGKIIEGHKPAPTDHVSTPADSPQLVDQSSTSSFQDNVTHDQQLVKND